MERIKIEQWILKEEWEMFQDVRGIGGRADCQDQWETFVIMRLSQFESWPVSVLASYLNDLEEAKGQERNLIMEKYAYMMEETDPVYFASIKVLLPGITEEVRQLAMRITEHYIRWEKEVALVYPNVRKQGRPVGGENLLGETSLENYLKCELYTYSKFTLQALLETIEKDPGTNLYQISLMKIAQAYGYASLDEAEGTLSKLYA